jgi:hypothetical protein
MSNQKVYNLTLSRVVKGSSGRTRLAFSVVESDDDDSNCSLSKIEISGRAIVDDLEVRLVRQNTSSIGTQTWRLESAEDVTTEDKNGNEIEIHVQDVVLKTSGNGQAMAMAVFGRQGESVLTTDNWYECIGRVVLTNADGC